MDVRVLQRVVKTAISWTRICCTTCWWQDARASYEKWTLCWLLCSWTRSFRGWGSVMVWAAIIHGYRSPLVVIDGNLNAQRYRDDILAHHVIPLFHNNANISIFQRDNATSHTARDTVNLGQITLISLMTGPLTVLISTPSSMSGIVWTDDWGVVPTHPLTSTNFVNTLVNSMRRRCTALVIPVIKWGFFNPYHTWSTFLPVYVNIWPWFLQ